MSLPHANGNLSLIEYCLFVLLCEFFLLLYCISLNFLHRREAFNIFTYSISLNSLLLSKQIIKYLTLKAQRRKSEVYKGFKNVMIINMSLKF